MRYLALLIVSVFINTISFSQCVPPGDVPGGAFSTHENGPYNANDVEDEGGCYDILASDLPLCYCFSYVIPDPSDGQNNFVLNIHPTDNPWSSAVNETGIIGSASGQNCGADLTQSDWCVGQNVYDSDGNLVHADCAFSYGGYYSPGDVLTVCLELVNYNNTDITICVGSNGPANSCNANAGADITICEGESTTLTATGGATYEWDNGLGTGASQSVSPLTTTTYTVTVDGDNDCTDDITVTVNAPIDPTFSQGAICSGDALNLPTSSDDTPAITGTWSPAEDNTTTTTYTFTPDAGECANTINYTVDVYDAVTVDNINVACNASQADYTVTFDINDGEFTSYVVTPAGTLTGNTYTSDPITAGTAYSFTVTDANNCNPVIVSGASPDCSCPVIGSISGDASICPGESSDLTFSFSGGTAPYDIVYTDGTSNFTLNGLTGSTTTQTLSPTSTTTYTIVSINDVNCTGLGSGSATITVNALPDLSVSASSDICSGTGTDITLNFTGTAEFSFTYNNGGTPITQTGINTNPYILSVAPASTTTYTFTEVSDNYCTSTINETITITTHNGVTVTNVTDNCINSDTQYEISFDISGGDVSSYTVTPSGTLTGSSFTSNPITSATNYSFTVTDQYDCDPQVISGNIDCSCPVTGTLSGNTTICAGESTQLTFVLAGGTLPYDIVYTDGSTNFNATANTTVYTVNVSPTATTTYTLVSVADNTCSGSVLGSATITISPSPDAQIQNNHEICIGESVDLNFTFTGTPPIEIVYTDGTNNYTESGINSSPYTVNVSPSNTTTYTLVSVQDASCTGTISGSSTITVHQLPNVDAGLDQAVCDGGNISLCGSGASNYTWDNGIVDCVYFVPLTTTTYSVTGTDVYGCINTDQVVVSVGTLPTAEAGADVTICQGDSTQLTASGGVSYEWSTNPISTINPFYAKPNNTTTYTVTVTDVDGCSAEDNVTVFVNHIPIANAGVDVDICDGDNITLTATSNTSVTYSWSNGLGVNQQVTVSPSTTTTYTVSVSDNIGCSNTDEVTVNVYNTINMQVNPSDTVICYGESVALVASTGFDTYAWFPGYGLSNVQGAVVSASPGQTTNYTVLGTYGPGCKSSANVMLRVDKVVANIPYQDPLCNGETVTLRASVTDGIAPYTYLWQGTTNTSEEITEQLFERTSFSVLVTDSLSCQAIANINVYVYDSLHLNAYSNVDSICPGDTILANAHIWGGTGAPYQLLIDGEYAQAIKKIKVSQDHDYVFEARDGCMSVLDTLRLNTYPVPYVDFISDKYSLCEDETVKFTSIVQAENLAETYKWNFGSNDNNNLSLQANPEHIFKNHGVFDVSLQIRTINGCIVDTLKHQYIHVDPKPRVDFKAIEEHASILNPSIYFNNQTEGATSYYWNFGTGDESNIENPFYKYNSVGNYEVTLVGITEFGCKDTMMRFVSIEPEIKFWIPTAFTPDADHINDIFLPVGTNILNTGYSMRIFDRWGEQIFESTDLNIGWDGTVKGNDYAKPGVYTYLIIFKDIYNISHEESGAVHLIW